MGMDAVAEVKETRGHFKEQDKQSANVNAAAAVGEDSGTCSPLSYCVTQGICFFKRSEDPRSNDITRTKREVGSVIHTNGRTWRGPRGALWAQVDESRSPSDRGWVLVEGPGFGIAGQLLASPTSEKGLQLIEIGFGSTV